MTDQHQPAAVAPRLSEDEISEIRVRADKAIPGPWVDRDGQLLVDPDTNDIDFVLSRCNMDELTLAFIAHARLDVPRLLADLARTRAEVEALRAALIDVADRAFSAHVDAVNEKWFYVHREITRIQDVIRVCLSAPQLEQPATPVDRSAEPTHQSWCALGRFSYSHCTCDATTPPDHQAGDGDDADVR